MTRTLACVALLLLLLLPATVTAQTQQIRRGTPMYFDHDEQSLVVTQYYQLCEDTITEASCRTLENVVRLQGSLTFQFALPTWVKNGAHIYVIRAFGEGEFSDPSNTLTLQVTGRPLPPQNYRQTNPVTTTPTTTTTTPPPAVVR